MPEVPDATEQRKAPAIVVVAFIVNEAVFNEFVITDGSAVVAVPNVQALRLRRVAAFQLGPYFSTLRIPSWLRLK